MNAADSTGPNRLTSLTCGRRNPFHPRGAACRLVLAFAAALTLAGCTIAPPELRPDLEGHLNEEEPAPARGASIPQPVRAVPVLPPPAASPPSETYTVVVNDVPVRELLFALARDAEINVDIHPEIDGFVTLNAVDQTLDEILDRLSRQLPVRYEKRGDSVMVEPDSAFFRPYQLDYVNITRESSGVITTSTEVASVGGDGAGTTGDNASDSQISNSSTNQLWENVQRDLEALVKVRTGDEDAEDAEEDAVIVNRESGVIMVRATSKQHEVVEDYLSRVSASVTRQVLIEATIVEVRLSDRFQAGIDWSFVSRRGNFQFGTALGGGFDAVEGITGLVFGLQDSTEGDGSNNFQSTVTLLKNFGDTRVISSPKIMTLNNQSAVLKVVDNEVYFEIELDEEEATDFQGQQFTVTSEVRTVPVGLVMNVTPQVDSRDVVTLNVRPTITDVREFVTDPGVAITVARLGLDIGGDEVQVTNEVPVIQVRETETVMRVPSGNIGVLGGLIQDRAVQDDESVPGLSDIDPISDLFKFRDRQQIKTELVVFLRPTVIRSPSVNADLAAFRAYLPKNVRMNSTQPTPFAPADVADWGTQPPAAGAQSPAGVTGAAGSAAAPPQP